MSAEELDQFVETLARRIAALPAGVAAAGKAAATPAGLAPFQEGLATENKLMSGLFQLPAAAERTSRALAAGAQTREGAPNLEGILNSL